MDSQTQAVLQDLSSSFLEPSEPAIDTKIEIADYCDAIETPDESLTYVVAELKQSPMAYALMDTLKNCNFVC